MVLINFFLSFLLRWISFKPVSLVCAPYSILPLTDTSLHQELRWDTFSQCSLPGLQSKLKHDPWWTCALHLVVHLCRWGILEPLYVYIYEGITGNSQAPRASALGRSWRHRGDGSTHFSPTVLDDGSFFHSIRYLTDVAICGYFTLPLLYLELLGSLWCIFYAGKDTFARQPISEWAVFWRRHILYPLCFALALSQSTDGILRCDSSTSNAFITMEWSHVNANVIFDDSALDLQNYVWDEVVWFWI